ncbi:MAG: DNA-processing protein DprA [Thermotaleaceae bacterium]
MIEEKYYIHWLHSTQGIGLKTLERLLKHFGSGKRVYEAADRELMKVEGINHKVLHNIIKNKTLTRLEEIANRASELNISSIYRGTNDYPQNLINMYDSPFLLYKRGEVIEQDAQAIAIVGARKATVYGKWAAYKFANELAKRGITIISGMAYGIDTMAHRGALDAGGRTIAVLGCGVDICYPKSNMQLMKEIIGRGAVVSEYPIGMEPMSSNFPGRNRIISGLSKGVIVVEAGLKSGSLITAEIALEQGREVFAVPGNINSVMSMGCNKLIQDGAKLVSSIEDVLEELNIHFEHVVKSPEINLSSTEREVYEKIEKTQPIPFEKLSYLLQMNVQEVNSILTILQIKGLIEQLPGKILIIK